MSDSRDIETQVARLILQSKRAIALTGAGISVPSGIPDFRSPEGLWSRYDVMEYGTLHAFKADPHKVWKLLREIGNVVESAQPNPAHRALAALETMGLLKGIVTQNIDALHQRAGSTNVVEFHGSCSGFSCLCCGARYRKDDPELTWGSDGIPLCECTCPVKPDIVLFGETIPRKALEDGFHLVQKADLVLVVGTSATVAPASSLPAVVRSAGGRIVEMNLTHTELSSRADFRILGDVATTLPSLVERVRQLQV